MTRSLFARTTVPGDPLELTTPRPVLPRTIWMPSGRLRSFIDEFVGGGTTAQHFVDYHRSAACGHDELRRQQVSQHASDGQLGSRRYPVSPGLM